VTAFFPWCITIAAGLQLGEGTSNCNKRCDLYLDMHVCIKVKKASFGTDSLSHYRPEVPRGFQGVKVPRLRDSGPGRW